MKNLLLGTLPAALAIGAVLAGSAQAAEILVTANISSSTTWTANNTYNLQNQIYVLPGATLTIQAGTLVQSTTNIGGSLAVCRGAQIFVLGTQDKPVIMTSKADNLTSWHEGCNEWGNLTIMGAGYISENAVPGNTPVPSASNVANMEGLVNGPTTDQYGGGNDDDDSGTVKYLSLRYGGKVVGVGNELNGLSLGGIGRDSCIHHVDIMNNVDDGVEIWGGTVNLSYFNIWNIGDDCFDIDQGWRGKAQFGLLVQGYSINANQGSGVGDNGFEMDGAEDSDWQPVTTAVIDNFTLIGQPASSSSQSTAWRDNARVQFHNCIFMDGSDDVVHDDNVDGDGAHGYGFDGTLTWLQTWSTPYTAFSTVNAPQNPGDFYKAQTSGNLAEIKDSVFFRNIGATAYVEANNVGVFNAGNNNVQVASVLDADAPIQSITRAAPVVKGGKTMVQVIGLDPRPKNDALVSVTSPPADGFFKPVTYRGAFAPNETWLYKWTASWAYGFTPTTSPFVDVGGDLNGIHCAPRLDGHGTLVAGTSGSIELTNAKGSSAATLFVGAVQGAAPFKGGTLVPVPWLLQLPLGTSPTGALTLPWASWPSGLSGVSLYFQYAVQDTAAVHHVALSNALKATSP